MTSRMPLIFLMLLGFLVLSGCSRSGPEPLEVFPVAGYVRLDGQPAGGVSVAFVPDAGVSGRGGYAVTDEAGKFSMISDQGDGVPAGKYRVLFSKLTTPDGSPIPEGAMAADLEAVNSLPTIYNDPVNTPTVAEVKAGKNAPLEFDLKSR